MTLGSGRSFSVWKIVQNLSTLIDFRDQQCKVVGVTTEEQDQPQVRILLYLPSGKLT